MIQCFKSERDLIIMLVDQPLTFNFIKRSVKGYTGTIWLSSTKLRWSHLIKVDLDVSTLGTIVRTFQGISTSP
ncbi:hypothetical protein GIB67_030171 [Kingdonia uniflora]|uniref:Uncharacterized protein n=1 Tax=Kingdonia uniflora TaxID=39325 RepID=A0A7J7LEJ4_9MAGN|nr:hypothetical protein GIB67_030171 [Kingdonia uniflora]